MGKTRIRFPRSRGLQNLNRLFWHATDWNWIFARYNLTYTLPEYNASDESDWLHVKTNFDMRDVPVHRPTRSRLRLAGLPYITRTWTLHVLQAGCIIAGNPKRTRLVLQGSILVVEWEHPVSPTASAPNRPTAIEFLQQLPDFTARIMVRGNAHFVSPSIQYLILALETSAFVLN
ncbi:hypothetical protein OC845_006947 [Tilletia horrida]|nr:hypothetical protein OC845_006947 [Tilletia horrida]